MSPCRTLVAAFGLAALAMLDGGTLASARDRSGFYRAEQPGFYGDAPRYAVRPSYGYYRPFGFARPYGYARPYAAPPPPPPAMPFGPGRRFYRGFRPD